MSVLDRVRADLARGEPWLGRDRLVGAPGSRPAWMGDLPAAGASWWLTDRATPTRQPPQR